jgi:uncharacterized repeat protein (TIGR03803 family)
MMRTISLPRFVMQLIGTLSVPAVMFGLLLVSADNASAQASTTLYRFCTQPSCASGSSPQSLVQATDGNFYGMTLSGGANDAVLCSSLYEYGCGTVFKITPDGALTTLYSFCTLTDCADGALPNTALIQAADGDFYGTTPYGGTQGGGTVFRITTSGQLTTLYNFCAQLNCADGSLPQTALIEAANGDLYGTTAVGGANSNSACTAGCGTVFKITQSGTLKTLYSFCTLPGCADGADPGTALIQATDGDFYGTTKSGGLNVVAGGTVFEITPTGTLTTLYDFCSKPNCADGYEPEALILSAHGNIYGMTLEGGYSDYGTANGTIFRISRIGTLSALYDICDQGGECAGGVVPAALMQATDGVLYGTTLAGGTTDYAGTLFEMAPSGKRAKLHNFCAKNQNCEGGAGPNALIQATSGALYGTTADRGAAYDGGTIYSFDVGLAPFVALKTTTGAVGAKVTLLGTNLSGATAVTFNGTPAMFTVNSTATAIFTTVPAGATTGPVQVVTPSGTLNGNAPYRVVAYEGSAPVESTRE